MLWSLSGKHFDSHFWIPEMSSKAVNDKQDMHSVKVCSKLEVRRIMIFMERGKNCRLGSEVSFPLHLSESWPYKSLSQSIVLRFRPHERDFL